MDCIYRMKTTFLHAFVTSAFFRRFSSFHNIIWELQCFYKFPVVLSRHSYIYYQAVFSNSLNSSSVHAGNFNILWRTCTKQPRTAWWPSLKKCCNFPPAQNLYHCFGQLRFVNNQNHFFSVATFSKSGRQGKRSLYASRLLLLTFRAKQIVLDAFLDSIAYAKCIQNKLRIAATTKSRASNPHFVWQSFSKQIAYIKQKYTESC